MLMASTLPTNQALSPESLPMLFIGKLEECNVSPKGPVTPPPHVILCLPSNVTLLSEGKMFLCQTQKEDLEVTLRPSAM